MAVVVQLRSGRVVTVNARNARRIQDHARTGAYQWRRRAAWSVGYHRGSAHGHPFVRGLSRSSRERGEGDVLGVDSDLLHGCRQEGASTGGRIYLRERRRIHEQ